jgi:hypothetical protein
MCQRHILCLPGAPIGAHCQCGTARYKWVWQCLAIAAVAPIDNLAFGENQEGSQTARLYSSATCRCYCITLPCRHIMLPALGLAAPAGNPLWAGLSQADFGERRKQNSQLDGCFLYSLQAWASVACSGMSDCRYCAGLAGLVVKV